MSDTHQHPLKMARLHRNLTQQGLAVRTQLGLATIKRAEAGEPISADSRERLCLYFGKTAQELGLVSEEHAEVSSNQTNEADQMLVRVSPTVQSEAPLLLKHNQAVSRPYAAEGTLEEQLGAWLVLEAGDMAQLFDEGWSLETLLESLQIVLKGVQAMQKFSRRKLLQLSAAAVVSNVVVPEGRHPSAEDRMQLCRALGESIGAGWRLFHTVGNAQVLAVSHAQLILVQQSHAMLPSRDRSRFYSSVYNLMGKSLHLQERYQEALEAHMNAHIAAMGTGDALQIVQSLICQADSYQSLGEHSHAIEAIEEALRLVGNPSDETLIRAKAHLLACWAENAMALGERTIAQEKMEVSAAYLDRISLNEEFDRAHWLQIAGRHALMSDDYTKAIEYYTQTLNELPPNWVIRQAFTLVPLMVAYACQRNREASLAVANKAVAVVSTLNAPSINKQFTISVQQGLGGAFPHDEQVQQFMADLPYRLPVLKAATVRE
jgi:tetratricopeptide (TPR) repeat protein